MGDRWWSSDTVAVVTGGNKGIGLEIVRRLAVEGLTVILTARDDRRGLQATQGLHSQGYQNVVFRTLDISSEESVDDFVEWIGETYGGLDILVNNAAVFHSDNGYDGAVETLRVNYQGTMDVIEKLLPLFRPRVGARIVTVSSWAGRLQSVNNESLRKQLTNESEYDQDFIDETASRYLEECRTGNGGPNGYANNAYRFSKVLLNAYLRLLQDRLSSDSSSRNIDVHNAHPGFVHTDMHNQVLQILGYEAYVDQVKKGRFGGEQLITVEEGADTPVWLCLVPHGHIPSGLLWAKRQVMSYL